MIYLIFTSICHSTSYLDELALAARVSRRAQRSLPSAQGKTRRSLRPLHCCDSSTNS
jgi:hypothetical protein